MKQSRQDFLKSRKTQRQLANSQSRIELARIRKKPLIERLLKILGWGSKNYSFVATLIVLSVIILQLLDIPLLKTIGFVVLGALVVMMTLRGFILKAAPLNIYRQEQGGKCIVVMYETHNEMESNSKVVIKFISVNDKYALEDIELEIEDNKLIFHTPYGRKAYKINNLKESDVDEFVEVFDDLRGKELKNSFTPFMKSTKSPLHKEVPTKETLLGQNLAIYKDEQYKEDDEDEWEETDKEEYEEEEESKYSQSKETQNDTQSYQTPESMQKVLEQMAMTMAHYNQQFQHTLSQQGKLDKYNEASLRYAHKERDNAFMEIFKLSTEEFEKLTPKDFEDFQGLLDARIIECVEALRFESLSFEVNLTQAFAKNISSIPRCEVELFVPLSNEENQHTIGFNTKDFAKKPSIKPNRTFFFNLLKAGANVDMGLVEQVQNLFVAYRNAHSERIDYYNSDNEEWEKRYYDSQAEEEYLDSHPVVKILQEMMLALQACLYAPKLSRTEVLNELDKEVRLSSWNMPQVVEYFVYNQGELIGYKRQQLEKNAQFVDIDSAIASLQSVLESGEKAFLYADDDILDSRLDTESIKDEGEIKNNQH